jgi:tetratricopeptide (TPR) repeat protein
MTHHGAKRRHADLAQYESVLPGLRERNEVHFLETLEEYGDLCEFKGRHDSACKAFEEVLAKLPDAPGDVRRPRLMRKLGASCIRRGDLTRAAELLNRAVRELEKMNEPLQLAITLNLTGAVANAAGDHVAAVKHAHLAAALARQAGDDAEVAASERVLGVAGNLRGLSDYARKHFESAIRIYHAMGMTRETADTLQEIAEGRLAAAPEAEAFPAIEGHIETALKALHDKLTACEGRDDRQGTAAEPAWRRGTADRRLRQRPSAPPAGT